MKEEAVSLGDIITAKDWQNFTILNFLKKIHAFLKCSDQITIIKKPQKKNK